MCGISAGAHASTLAQQDPCATDQIILNTGYDHLAGAVLPTGTIDARWTLVQDPFTSTVEPRPAAVIQKYSTAWANAETGSQWISGYPSAAQSVNGDYWFETTFCLRPGADLSQCLLQIGMRADDACTAYLNGTEFHTGQSHGAAVLTIGNYSLGSLGVIGTNALRIRVENLGNVAMGLDLVATVFASPNGTAEKPECCSARGALQGQKYNDLNGNGARDANEPAMSGWQINLSLGGTLIQSKITDVAGYYSFPELMPGTYTISETQQFGWTQTAPPSGAHVVTLQGLVGLNHLDFGNHLLGQPCFDSNYGVPIGTGDDVVLPLQSIGFAFPFDGVNYSDFYASTNGFVYLRNGPASPTPSSLCCVGNPTIALANSIGPMICPFWTDLIMTPGTNVMLNSSMSATTITWQNAIEFGDTGGTFFHVQLKLYPSGQIDFTYTTNMAMRTTGNAFVGVTPGGGAINLGSSNLSAPGLASAPTVYELFHNATLPFDLAGSKVTLMPSGSGFAYDATPCPIAIAPASIVAYGGGCVPKYQSIYERFQLAVDMDLDNVAFVHSPDWYFSLIGPIGPGAYVPPSPAATTLALTDDSELTLALSTAMPFAGSVTSALTVCSNGYVSAAPGNGTSYQPTATTLLAMSQPVFACIHDYNPAIAGSGQVKFEETAGLAVITWDGVYSYGTTAPDSFQFQFNLVTGDVAILWLSSSGLGNGKLVGYSAGSSSLDPGSRDLSAVLPALVEHVQVLPLGISATGLPAPGQVVTLDATNLPPGSLFGVILLGQTRIDPGLPLDGLGMPGCQLYNEMLAITSFLVSQTGAALAIPPGPTFLGAQLQAQAAVFAPGVTPFGFVTSHGLEIQIGN